MEELKLVNPKEEIEIQESISQAQEEFSEAQTRGSQGRRNPPARNTSRFWFERFLAVIQRQNPSLIDAAFLSQIAPSNEGKLLAQLKFLHVIDDQGRPTRLLPALNMVGQDQKKGFHEITNEAYGELLEEVKVERAVPDDIVNFFIRKYSFTRDKAIHAARFFLYLAEKSSMQISPELASFLVEKERTGAPASGLNGSVLPVAREPKASGVSRSLPKKGTSREETGEPLISATINIKLDKDTPREYWDRVLALLGERKNVALQVQINGSDTESPPTESAN